MAVRVRRLEGRDHSAWLALFRAYIAFYRASVPDDVVALTWRRLMGEAPEMLGLAAVDDEDQPVGFVIAVFHLSSWAESGYCYLEDLYVAPTARRHGAGQALIEAVYAAADERGVTRTYWVTEEGNETARKLYDRLATRAPYVQYRR